MTSALTLSLAAYMIVMLLIAWWAKSKVHTEEDFIVAGRRLPLFLSSATLLATWFGAGTLLTATDEIQREGLVITALEPYGAGLCLLIAGAFFAKPLWEAKVCTLSDLYGQRFGKKAEVISAVVMIPGYIGWVAVQLVALAGIFNLLFGLGFTEGIILLGLFALVYTWLGGMWSVALTDAVQLVFLVIGILGLGYAVYSAFGQGEWTEGLLASLRQTESEQLVLIPTDSLMELTAWIGVLAVASLGNIPGQDLTQRLFSAKSAKTATLACYISGALYIALGTIPALLGVSAHLFLSEDADHSVMIALALQYLHPAFAIVFTLAVVSAVFSTIDSAILAPATTLSRNILRRFVSPSVCSLKLSRLSLILIAALSIVTALIGENAYNMLEASYEISFVSLFVPICAALFFATRSEPAVIASMIVGCLVWLLDFVVESEFPISLLAVGAAFLTYMAWSKYSSSAARKNAELMGSKSEYREFGTSARSRRR